MLNKNPEFILRYIRKCRDQTFVIYLTKCLWATKTQYLHVTSKEMTISMFSIITLQIHKLPYITSQKCLKFFNACRQSKFYVNRIPEILRCSLSPRSIFSTKFLLMHLKALFCNYMLYKINNLADIVPSKYDISVVHEPVT